MLQLVRVCRCRCIRLDRLSPRFTHPEIRKSGMGAPCRRGGGRCPYWYRAELLTTHTLHKAITLLTRRNRTNPPIISDQGVCYRWSCRESNPGPSSPRQGFSVRSSRIVSARPTGSGEHVRLTGPASVKSPRGPHWHGPWASSLSRCQVPGWERARPDRHASR